MKEKKKQNCQLSWEIPSTVDLEAFLEKFPPTFAKRPKIDYFYSLIEHLSSGMDEQDLDVNEGFVNMNAQKMQQFNHSYKLYLDHLLGNGFIRTDMEYIPGKKSKGFLLNRYNGHRAEVKRIPIEDFIIRQKRKKEWTLQLKEKTKADQKYGHITKWFNAKLQIDVAGATKKVEELFPAQAGRIRGKRKGKPSDWAKRYKAIYSINKFANQEFYYSVDDNVGRFHSNLTNIKRELRCYITYDGQKLVNVDIKNAQPFFSTLLLNKNFYERQTSIINFYSFPTFLKLLLPPSSSNTINYPLSTTIIMLVKSLKKLIGKGFGDYENYVNSGDFYKKLADTVYPNQPYDKQAMKTMVFTIFFSNNRYMGQKGAKPKKDFKEHFPNVFEVFRLIKVKNHRALAHLLQRIESAIMIGAVASRIAKERPDLPFFTIHDSIATTEGNEEYVAKIVMEEIIKLTNLTVKLGIEIWDEFYVDK
jgi:hypothetical protein